MNMKSLLSELLILASGAVFAAEPFGIYGLNADWRFAKATKPIPLAQAKASVETAGAKVESPSFDDSAWETVSLPHPINAHDSFDDRAVDAGEARLWRGMAFYRKRFTLPAAMSDECSVMSGVGCKYFLSFETVRQTIYVWVNGEMVGYYEAGVAPTCFDVTGAVREGENLLVVATDNCASRGTKIFTLETMPGHEPGDMSGRGYQWNTTDFNEVQGGLVGNVMLHVKPKTYLTLPFYNNLKTVGTYVTAKDFDFAAGSATVVVKAEVRNESSAESRVSCLVSLVDPLTGKNIASGASASVSVPAAKDVGMHALTAVEVDAYEKAPLPTRVVEPETTVLTVEIPVKGLTFWSPETPQLYDVKVELADAVRRVPRAESPVGAAREGTSSTVLDAETIRTGFRAVEYDAAKGGLLINGKNVWLTGYAQRATDEWAAIGVAPDWLQDFDARLIRESNANFVRWMHVAPKPAPVRAFDKYGIVNVCPAGDKEGDVTGRAWAQRVEAMRDVMIYYRNSPSILFWEAGNNHISPAHMREMRELKAAIDPDGGRFMGCRTLQAEAEVAEAEYVGTMLHRHETPAFAAMKKLGRFLPIMETEYARQESPRRCWDDFTPPDFDYRSKWLGGGRKETGFDVYDQTQEDFALSTAKEYAEYYSAWSNGEGTKTYAACAALCWTDSNQHGRQSASENCRMSGRVDPVRIPKQNFAVFRTMQSQEPAVKIVGHWNYPKLTPTNYWCEVKKHNGKYWAPTGEKARRDPTRKTVFVIGSPHVASVELFVNGKSKGVETKPERMFVWSFDGIDVTESGAVEAVARDAAGKEIARDRIETAGAPAKLVMAAHTGPKGWLADGADIAVIDLKLVDAQGRTCPLADNKVEFSLTFQPSTSNPEPSTCAALPRFMGGYNSGVWGDDSPIGKNWVKLECGVNRVFLKAGRAVGLAKLTATAGRWKASVAHELKPVSVTGGLTAEGLQSEAPNRKTYVATSTAPVVQKSLGTTAGAVKWTVRVNGGDVDFGPRGLGAPVKPDANTGVTCAYEPVLEALKRAGADFEYVVEPKRIPANKKWLRKLAPSPYQPMVTVKTGGHEIDACLGFTELFLDNGKDKNLTNCEIYTPKAKSGIVCGELTALVGYIPGVKVKENAQTRVLELTVRK